MGRLKINIAGAREVTPTLIIREKNQNVRRRSDRRVNCDSSKDDENPSDIHLSRMGVLSYGV